MPSPYFTAILSGGTTSAPFTIDRPAPALAILVPSWTASDLRIEYGATSGGNFGVLTRGDGSGVPWSAYSGAGPATAIVPVATSFARLTSQAAQADTRSFVILTVRQYP